MCRAKENGREEEIGYVPGDFLKRFDPAQSGDENSIEVRKKYLGFVSSAAMTDSVTAEVDSALKYVATEDYQSDDPRQLCFSEGTVLIVVEKSEDGTSLNHVQAVIVHIHVYCAFKLMCLLQQGGGWLPRMGDKAGPLPRTLNPWTEEHTQKERVSGRASFFMIVVQCNLHKYSKLDNVIHRPSGFHENSRSHQW